VALIFVTHNLGIIAKMCDKVAVMYAGRIVEQAPVRALFDAPKHPYTRALLGAVPKLGSKEPLYSIPGQPPNLATLPAGCAFHPRCPEAVPRCTTEEPGDFVLDDGGVARCWLLERHGGADTNRGRTCS
jgi:oligopeptide/dipeptide ABC transporter ATP-binding protein